MKKKLTVVKIGGNVIDDPQALGEFLGLFARLQGPKLLVHGGGVMASQVLRGMGIEPVMVDGRRITDAGTLRVVTMVYGGWINKDIVARLQAFGCDAIGISGADGNVIPAVKRPIKEIDYGFVGDVMPEKVNSAFVSGLIERGFVPVLCSITHDGAGGLLNTNADTIASALAVAMSGEYEVSLVYCFEKKGVLANPEDDCSVVPLMNRTEYERMKESGAVKAGMIAKLENVFPALENGVGEVIIKQASALLEEGGTTIKL